MLKLYYFAILYFILLLEFELIETGFECAGNETYKGFKASLEACAFSCRGSSEMFIYAINQRDMDRCKGSSCECFCEHDTVYGSSGPRCEKMLKNTKYKLYVLMKGRGIWGLYFIC